MTSQDLITRLHAIYGPNEQEVAGEVLSAYFLIIVSKNRLSRAEFVNALVNVGGDKAKSFADFVWDFYDKASSQEPIPTKIEPIRPMVQAFGGFKAFHV